MMTHGLTVFDCVLGPRVLYRTGTLISAIVAKYKSGKHVNDVEQMIPSKLNRFLGYIP